MISRDHFDLALAHIDALIVDSPKIVFTKFIFARKS